MFSYVKGTHLFHRGNWIKRIIFYKSPLISDPFPLVVFGELCNVVGYFDTYLTVFPLNILNVRGNGLVLESHIFLRGQRVKDKL